MGYFSNGTEGEMYFDKYCANCIHDNEQKGVHCPIWNLHLLHNYADCNNENSYLHTLIELDESGFNKRCSMFVDRGLFSNLAIEKLDSDALNIHKHSETK